MRWFILLILLVSCEPVDVTNYEYEEKEFNLSCDTIISYKDGVSIGRTHYCDTIEYIIR